MRLTVGRPWFDEPKRAKHGGLIADQQGGTRIRGLSPPSRSDRCGQGGSEAQGFSVKPSSGNFVSASPHAPSNCVWVRFLALLRSAPVRLAPLGSTGRWWFGSPWHRSRPGYPEIEPFDEGRNGGDLVGFFKYHLLTEHQPAVGREGRHQMQRLVAGSPIVGAARRVRQRFNWLG